MDINLQPPPVMSQTLTFLRIDNHKGRMAELYDELSNRFVGRWYS